MLNKSFGVWLAIVLALGYGGYILWFTTYTVEHWYTSLYSLPYFIGGIALLFNQQWSKYFYYIMAVLGIGSWVYGVWYSYNLGWAYPDLQRSIISLIPGVLLVIVYSGVAWVVRKHFTPIEKS